MLRDVEIRYDNRSSGQDFTYADIDGDGDLDLISTNGTGVLFHLRTDATTFTFDSVLDLGTGIRAMVTDDVNADGWVDLILRDAIASEIIVLLSDRGVFTTPFRYPLAVTGSSSRGTDSLHVGDVDGDYVVDIVTANGRPSRSSGGSTLSFLKGNGDGTFRTPLDYAAGRQVTDLAVTDANGDGTTDIIAGSYYDGVITTLIGDRPRTLQLKADGLHDLPDLSPVAAGSTDSAHILSADRDGSVGLWTYHSDPEQLRREAIVLEPGSTESVLSMFGDSDEVIVSTNAGHRVVDPSNGTGSLLAAGNGDAEFIPRTLTNSFLAEVMLPVDLNGDNRDDLVYIESFAGLNVVLQQTDGTFSPREGYVSQHDDGTFVFPENLAFGLFNGDTALDVITVNPEHDSISVFLGDGMGAFPSVEVLDVGLTPRAVELADIDGDAFIDILVGEEGGVRLLRSDGMGSIVTNEVIPSLDFVDALVVTDIDEDGDQDLIVSGFNTVGSSRAFQIDVLLNDGSGDFSAVALFNSSVSSSTRSTDLTVKDVDRDGSLDVIAVYGERNSIGSDLDTLTVLLGDGAGSFQTPDEFEVPDDPLALLVEDVTGDGVLDALTAHSHGGLSLLVGNGDGTFRESVELYSGTAMRTLKLFASDFNGDSIPDPIAAFNGADNGTVVLESQPLIGNIASIGGHVAVVGEQSIAIYNQGTSSRPTISLLPDIVTSEGTVSGERYSLLKTASFEDGLAGLVLIDSATPYSDLVLFDATMTSGESLLLSDRRTLVTTNDDVLITDGTTILFTAEVLGAGNGSEPFYFQTDTGLQLIGDILVGSSSSRARDFVVLGDSVYFTALSERDDNATGNTTVSRSVMQWDRNTSIARTVRAGVDTTQGMISDGTSLYFTSRVLPSTEDISWTFTPGLAEVRSTGASEADFGGIAGVVFLDRNSDGQQNAEEPGRAGVTLFVDLNDNGRREASEPAALTRFDDPATAVDETGRFEFTGLAAGTVRIREVPVTGFTQTTPLAVQSEAPQLTLLRSVTPGAGHPGLGLPSIVGDRVVFVDQTNAPASQLVVNGEADDLTIPNEAVAIQSLGSVHAQDGSSIVFTAILADGRELVLERDSRGDIQVVVDTGQAITSQPLGGQSSSTVLTDIKDGLNGGFDTLSISDGSAGFLAQSDDGNTRYYLGGISDGRFAEFNSGQAILDGDNEVFVDRVVEDTGVVISGADLFLDKATLDTQVGGNTGWRITTRSGDEILPLTFFDRILDVSVSGQSALFRATDVTGDESIFLATVNQGSSRVIQVGDAFPGVTTDLTTPVQASDTQITVDDASVFPQAGEFTIRIGNEQMRVVSVSGNTLSLVRGANGTAASTHPSSEPVELAIDGFGSPGTAESTPSVSLDGDNLVFVARGGSAVGLFAQINGTIQTLVDSGSGFDGKQLSSIEISHDALNGDSIVFLASFTDGTEGIYLAELPADPVANITVVAGETISGVLFGSRAEAGVIRGTSFTDSDLDGVFDAGEDGNAGRTVFLDANLNGQLDDSELRTVTDENGAFVFTDLPSETEYVVREVLPEGLAVTVPQTLAAATVRLGAASTVEIVLGSVDSAALGESADGQVAGVIFNDLNGNGVQDNGEVGLEGITVFVDRNGNRRLNGGERSTQTGPDGSYVLGQLRGIRQEVRVELPNDLTEQTNALGNSFDTQKIQTRDTPGEAAIVHLNDDEFPDLLVSVLDVGELKTFINDGNGEFTETEPWKTGGLPVTTVPIPLRGSANANAAVVAHPLLSRVEIVEPDEEAPDGSGFRRIGLISQSDTRSGGFLASIGSQGVIARGIATGDFNGDGFDDIAIAAEKGPTGSGGAVITFLGDSDGDFTHEQTLFVDASDAEDLLGITASRFTSAGRLDLVVTGAASNSVAVLRNSGSQSLDANRFVFERSLPTGGSRPVSVQVSDLNDDQIAEIVVANSLSGTVTVFTGLAGGSFSPGEQFSAGKFPSALRVVDLDGDDLTDIVFTVVSGSDRLGILRNLGAESPGAAIQFESLETSGVAALPDSTNAFSLAVGQLDSDETPDFVVTIRRDPGLQINADTVVAGLNTVNVALNSVVQGGLSVELPTGNRSVPGVSFGLSTVNDPPTLDEIGSPIELAEDADPQQITLTGISPGEEGNQTARIEVSSNNSTLFPAQNLDVVLNGDSSGGTLSFEPAADQHGTAELTVTVFDNGIDGVAETADDGSVSQVVSVTVTPANDAPAAEADTFGVVLENGAVTLDVLANDHEKNPDMGESLTILFASQPNSGAVAIVNHGQQLQYTPADGFIGQETFNYIVSDNQFTAQGTVTVNVTSSATPTDLLLVSSLTPNPSGFDVVFSEAFNASLLNLYSTQSLGPADVVVSGASTGIVAGSLIVDGAGETVSFIRTGGPLPADTYTVTLRSGANGFVSTDGDLLDGNSDGTGGDNFTTTFTIAPLGSETVTVSIPDFARGFGQEVNVPADGTGIPLTLDRGTGISGLNLEVFYDSNLLDITGFVPTVAGLLTDFNAETGALAVSKPTEFTGDPGPLTIGYFTANVPADALYTSKHLIEMTSLQVFDDSVDTALVPSIADSAIHVAAFPGDANASRSYNSPDTTLTLRQATDRIDGLSLYPLADPALISDVTFDTSILANDATVVQRLITNVDVPAVPDLPSGVDPLPARGPDPTLSIPQNLSGRLGQTVSVPVQVEVTEAAGITISGLDVAISYDASQFSVGNVRAGTLLTDNDQSPFAVFANTSTPGQLLVTASSSLGTTTLAQGTSGDVFLIDFTVLPSAAGGASPINLLASSGGLITGIADNDLSELVLLPAPSNAADDSVDGLLTVTTDVTLVDRSEEGQLTVRDASASGLSSDLTFTLDGQTLIITEATLPLAAGFGQQVSDQEVRVALADLSTSVVNVLLAAGDDMADGSALTSAVSLNVSGAAGNDTITGGAGNDTLSGGEGDDDLDGGGGTDTLTITQDGKLAITATQTFGQGTDSYTNIERAVLEGGSGNNRLDASGVTIPVTLLGQGGSDTLLGGSGVDRLDGGAGADFAEMVGSNLVLTDGSAPGSGGEVLIGVEGLQLVASVAGSTINASGYTQGSVTIVGSNGDDFLTGGSGNDLILAGAGRDSVSGGGGNDFIFGGRGRDTLHGDAGNDTLIGGGGHDTLRGGGGNDFAIGGGGHDVIEGGDNADRLFGGGGHDTIRSGSGNDLAIGGRGRDLIDGDDGDDTLFGRGGPDNIAGGLGADRLNGIDRDDTFVQTTGQDTLFGGQRPGGRGVAFREPETPAFTSPETSAANSGMAFESSGREASGVEASGLEASVTSGIDTAFADPLLPQLLER